MSLFKLKKKIVVPHAGFHADITECNISIVDIFPERAKNKSEDCIHLVVSNDLTSKDTRHGYIVLNGEDVKDLISSLQKYCEKNKL